MNHRFLGFGIVAFLSSAPAFSRPLPGGVDPMGLPRSTPDSVIDWPVYNSEGELLHSQQLTAQEAMNRINQWKDATINSYRSQDAGEFVQNSEIFANDLGANQYIFNVPQNPDQKRALDRQTLEEDRGFESFASDAASRDVSTVKGYSDTFGASESGNFRAQKDGETVKYKNSYRMRAYLFSGEFELISQNTETVIKKSGHSRRADVTAFGQSIFFGTDGSVNGDRNLSRTIDRSRLFYVGVPVRVRGRASGVVGTSFSYNPGSNAINGSVRPYMYLQAAAEASVDLLIVRAGIEGSMRFIENSILSTFSASYDSIRNSFNASLRLINDQTWLAGKLSVFVDIWAFFRYERYTHDIFSWNGWHFKNTLLNQSFSIPLGTDSTTPGTDGSACHRIGFVPVSASCVYRIRSKSTNLYLHEDGGGDRLISTRYQPNDGFTKFRFIHDPSNGSYRIRVVADSKDWHVQTDGDQLASTRTQSSDLKSSFLLDPWPDGSIRIHVRDGGFALHLDSGTGVLSAIASGHQDASLFYFEVTN